LYGGEATRQRILNESGDCHVLCYSGHAGFDPEDPLNSAVVLGRDDTPLSWLTLRDIFCDLHLRQNLLTIINGCETGLVFRTGRRLRRRSTGRRSSPPV